MKKNLIVFVSVLLIIFISFYNIELIAQVSDTVSLTNLKAGIAKVDITPPIGIPLAGYGDRDGPSTGIHDPLHTTVLVIDDGDTRAAIVSLDLLQVLQSSGNSMRKKIEELTGIPEAHIIINASHTHGGPFLLENTVYKGPWYYADPNYTKEVINKVAGAASLAVSRLRPVSIGYGEGSINFNVSRRLVDGKGRLHSIINPEGICDHRIKVLRIDDGNCTVPMAILMHAVCHPNVFRGANTEISADFPGIAQSFVEDAFGNKTTSMFLQGCAGDIRPKMYPVLGAYRGYRSGDDIDLFWCGYDLGAEVVQVATKLRVKEWVEKRSKNFKISVAYDVLKLDANENNVKDFDISNHRTRVENGKTLVPIRILRVGDIWFVGLPGEPVVEYGLKIEERMKDLGKIFVLGYLSGDMGYIPVDHMLGEGGLEAGGPFIPGVEEAILEGVDSLVSTLKDKKI